ncbi:enoyl-CoA hydratase-related protein, partial [Acinetobacter baumannii]|uniref:enoyl-CoA hydratase-related protein n=1 Tax=Acinetobacter baumannii TaxID=470 RepID=UPI00208ED5B8
LTGDRFDAATADAMGLVSQVVPKGEQFAVALKIATQISSRSAPLAVKRLLQSAKQGTEQDPKTAFANVLGYLPDLFLSQDFAEGVASLREKRPAQFQGK